MRCNSPLSEEKADRIISILGLRPQSKIIDIGCGQGELLLRMHKASKAKGLGVDINIKEIEKANLKIQEANIASNIQFLCADVQNTKLEREIFDLAICIGSTHAFGQGEQAYPNALQQMSELVKPNGLILLGEGYWKRAPDQEYLDFLGEPVGIYHDHEQNIQCGEELGLVLLYAAVSNQDEWDHFEYSHRIKVENRAITEPNNEALQKKLQGIREWNRYYRKFGRSTMGFGFYIFRKPEKR